MATRHLIGGGVVIVECAGTRGIVFETHADARDTAVAMTKADPRESNEPSQTGPGILYWNFPSPPMTSHQSTIDGSQNSKWNIVKPTVPWGILRILLV